MNPVTVGLKNRRLQLSLLTVAVLIAVCAGLIWANLRKQVVVSESPSYFGLPGLVSVRISFGWPLSYKKTNALVPRTGLDDFLAAWPDVGISEPQVIRSRLAANIVTGILLVAASGATIELTIRRFGGKR